MLSEFQIKTKVFIGNDSLNNILKLGYKKILIICDKFILESKLIDSFLENLKNKQVEYTLFTNIVVDTPLSVVMEGVKAVGEFEPDCILCVGGGSALDAGKAINLMFCKIQSCENVIDFIAVPTTSGTGSEVTSFSVVFDEENKVKYPLVSDDLLPKYAVLDSNLVKTLPLKITIDTAVDVLTHSIESYVSLNNNDFSDALAEKAIKIIYEYLPIVCVDLLNDEGRQKLHNASCMAGMSFNLTNLGLNHSMAHTLGANFHVPHGRANAVLMPYIIAFNAGIGVYNSPDAKVCKRYASLAKLLNKSDNNSVYGARVFLRVVTKFLSSLNVERDLRSLGINEDDFKSNLDSMVESAFKDGCLAANPKTCSKEDIKTVFLNAYYGKL